MNAPCKDCPRREVLCHSKCEEYQVYSAHREAERARRYEQTINNRPTEYLEKRIRRNMVMKHRFNGYGGPGK